MKTQLAEVLSNERIAQDTYRLSVKTDGQNARLFYPGKFVHIGLIDGRERLLRRPFGIAGYQDGVLSVIFQVKGKGTQAMAALRPGQAVDLLAPLGKGYFLKEEKKIWLVGGGLGVAPLLYVPRYYTGREYKSFFGFRNKACSYAEREAIEYCGEVFFVSDDGSFYEKGFVTDVLRTQLAKDTPEVILACGPAPMFLALKKALEGYDIRCLIAMEQRMGCGIGACMVCACETKSGGYKRVCMDGPVFDINEVF